MKLGNWGIVKREKNLTPRFDIIVKDVYIVAFVAKQGVHINKQHAGCPFV